MLDFYIGAVAPNPKKVHVTCDYLLDLQNSEIYMFLNLSARRAEQKQFFPILPSPLYGVGGGFAAGLGDAVPNVKIKYPTVEK